jgi:hypothetical protein
VCVSWGGGCMRADALMENIQQLPYLSIHVATGADIAARAQCTAPMFDSAARADEKASTSESLFLAADINFLSTTSWARLDTMQNAVDELVVEVRMDAVPPERERVERLPMHTAHRRLCIHAPRVGSLGDGCGNTMRLDAGRRTADEPSRMVGAKEGSDRLLIPQVSDMPADRTVLQSSTGSDSTMPNVGMVVKGTRTAYRIVRLVGHGAHGLVYLVQDADTSDFFCMKVRACDMSSHTALPQPSLPPATAPARRTHALMSEL